MAIRDILSEAFYSLGRRINKRSGDESMENAEGIAGPRLPELTLDMDETEMVNLSDVWERTWNDSDVKAKFIQMGDENEKYWKGEHYDKPNIDKSRSVVDNAIYEGLETYLPQVTRRNPEAMVELAVGVEQTPENQQFANALKLELGELADDLKLRLKLKGAARNHEVRLLGAIKLGWDIDNDRPALKVVRPTKLILDPSATVDEDGYTGERIGEHRKLPAWKLVRLIEKTKGSEETVKAIKEAAKDEMATEIGFIEWWTPEYFFWKMGKTVLLKRKNPHWNYETDQEPATDSTPQPIGLEQPQLPAGGPAIPALPQEQMPAAPAPKAVNHFVTPRMPFVLLSTANLGIQPVNVTSNITQNLANQDLINKRTKQIDKNADTSNNGFVVSLERSGLNADQAKRVANAIRNGGVVGIPTGSPQEAVWKPPASDLPVFIYNQLVDTRNRVRDIWGTRGSSPAGQSTEKTVRGKFLNRQLDTDRIGGGMAEYLEQMADDLYNWLVQLLYVYDDRFVQAVLEGAQIPKVKISVKEGSLLPKDSTTIANQAVDLATAGKMSLIDMYKKLDYANPEEMAANVWLEANAPELLFENDPRVQKVMQARQQAAKGQEKPPSESINFKDLPPEGQSQMARKVGIELNPEGIAAYEMNQKTGEGSAPAPALPAIGGP